MHIDTDSLVLPGEHILHVLNRRGLFHVKGQDVHRLYERLQPFLGASPGVDDLLLRIPEAQRPAVRTCLTTLRDLGALREDAKPALESHAAADEVLFMSPLEAGKWLLRASADGGRGRGQGQGQGPWSGRLTCVTVEGDVTADASVAADAAAKTDVSAAGAVAARTPGGAAAAVPAGIASPAGPGGATGATAGGAAAAAVPVGAGDAVRAAAPAAGEQARREVYARWLARQGREVLTEADWIRVYALSASGELRRIAVVSPSGEPGLEALPGQLGIVRCADVDQVPLVVLTAAHPFFAPSITHAGLHHEVVRDQVLREYVVRLHLAEDADLRARFYCGPVATPLSRYAAIAMAPTAIDSMTIAATLPALQLATLDRWAESRLQFQLRDANWASLDLLQSPQLSHRHFIAHLQQIVRVRKRELIAQVRETEDGFCTLRLGARSASSFLREKALADLLLAHVWDEFYRGRGSQAEPVLRCDYTDVAPDREQRAALLRAREVACREPHRPRFRFRSLRRWGIAAWTGDVIQ